MTEGATVEAIQEILLNAMLGTSLRASVDAVNHRKLATALTTVGLALGAALLPGHAEVGSPAYHAELSTGGPVKAGLPAELTITIKDASGRKTTAMEIVHERPMHLMIVSSDLVEFYHIHPTPSAEGVFHVTHVFPYGGSFRLFADFTPAGGANYVESLSLNVQGPARSAISPDLSFDWTKAVDGVRMTLASDKPLRAGEDIGFSMTVASAATGAPIQDLQRYLGAWAHIAVVSQDARDFLHIHPEERLPSTFEYFLYTVKRDFFHSSTAEVPGTANPVTLRTFAGFKRAGLYKMWVEVQRRNQVLTFPFLLRIAPGVRDITRTPSVPAGATLVKVSSAGYEPSQIPAIRDRPLRLAFYRVDAQNCGRVVRFPDLGTERTLPPGQIQVIEVTPRKSGSLTFSCGMNMMKGQLLVR